MCASPMTRTATAVALTTPSVLLAGVVVVSARMAPSPAAGHANNPRVVMKDLEELREANVSEAQISYFQRVQRLFGHFC